MKQLQRTLEIDSPGRGLVELTGRVAEVVSAARIDVGQCTVFCQHTSCSLLIHENASPDAAADLLSWLCRLAPDGDARYTHTAEGPDDMPAHLRTALTRTSEVIPVVGGRLALGTWQGLYLLEHRHARQQRSVLVHVLGEERR